MHFQHPQLNHYLQKPTGQLYIRSIRIGNVEFGDMVIQDRAGALHLQDLVQATYDHSEKIRRLRRNGTRYPEPLPLATPPGFFQKRSTTSSKTRNGRTFAPPPSMPTNGRLPFCNE